MNWFTLSAARAFRGRCSFDKMRFLLSCMRCAEFYWHLPARDVVFNVMGLARVCTMYCAPALLAAVDWIILFSFWRFVGLRGRVRLRQDPRER